MEPKIEGIALAAINHDAMVEFYSNVFGIAFTAEEVSGHHLHNGRFSGMDFTLVPNELSGVKNPSSPVHLEIFVGDIHASIKQVEQHGGRTNKRLGEDDNEFAIGVFDPDGNFMVIKQRKTA